MLVRGRWLELGAAGVLKIATLSGRTTLETRTTLDHARDCSINTKNCSQLRIPRQNDIHNHWVEVNILCISSAKDLGSIK